MEPPKILSFGKIEKQREKLKKVDPDNLLILPVINLAMFPGLTIPIAITRPESVKIVEYASRHNLPLGVICQAEASDTYPTDKSQLVEMGVIGQVLHIATMFDSTKTTLIQSQPRQKFVVDEIFTAYTPEGAFLSAKVTMKRDRTTRGKEEELDLILKAIISEFQKFDESGSSSGIEIKSISEAAEVLKNTEDKVNFLCNNFPGIPSEKIKLLKCSNITDRASLLLEMLYQNKKLYSLLSEIKERAQENMMEAQRHNFLQHHYDAIRNELYGDVNDADILRTTADEAGLPPYVRSHFDKELLKMERYNPQSPDYSLLYSYLETLCRLPWNAKTSCHPEITKAKEILDRDHYGMEDVKERILEQLAVIAKSPDVKSPILCLVGAPGVGKTSIGRSIATAMGRSYQRVSLGGVHDESEIRGHRRTYIGSMPGRIITALQKAEVNNPVLLLDEIDKLCSDIKGDPSAALLEVLDPEQNSHFHDNYIDVDFDLSDVFFIATANTTESIPRPLLDRMEVIEMPGYLQEEKKQIARRHLIPTIRKKYNLSEDEFDMTDEAINYVIRHYTSESGVRLLEKKLSELARKITLRNELYPEQHFGILSPENIRELLGLEIHIPDEENTTTPIGVATGLAWTAVGGEILQIEVSISPTKSPKLTLTGNLGNVMKESATLSLQYVRAHAKSLGIDPSIFEESEIHIHVPEGAIPKDGPSAGITITTALISRFTNRPIKPRVAMTGEMTLQGKILPVGGIKEKILAAKRYGITDIFLSQRNRRHIEDINIELLSGLNFHYVDHFDDLLPALTDI